MIVIDLLIGAYLVFKIYKGFKNGFISELSSLLAIVISLFVATHYYDYMLSFMQMFIKSDVNDMTVFARVITFVLTMLLVLLGSSFLTKLADFSQMGLFNKILGSIFGLMKSILILSIFLNIFAKFNAGKLIVSPSHINQSKLYYPMMEVSHTVFPIFGSWYAQYVYAPDAEREPQPLDKKDDATEDKK